MRLEGLSERTEQRELWIYETAEMPRYVYLPDETHVPLGASRNNSTGAAGENSNT
ncbi:MAG: hypothetical protein K2X81_26980 [Candidatus Obscuribacterales bacterium]|nr:hypothetical protein [Candidatus Obscuribacterales bacterium]